MSMARVSSVVWQTTLSHYFLASSYLVQICILPFQSYRMTSRVFLLGIFFLVDKLSARCAFRLRNAELCQSQQMPNSSTSSSPTFFSLPNSEKQPNYPTMTTDKVDSMWVSHMDDKMDEHMLLHGTSGQ